MNSKKLSISIPAKLLQLYWSLIVGKYNLIKIFLKMLKKLQKSSNGSLLIFDEVISGFRTHVGGAQKYYGVEPDLACFGKAMANGMPLSAIVGKKQIMSIMNEIFLLRYIR